jgi:hypothetical protein
MEEIKDWARYYADCERLERRNIRRARLMLVLLWIPATIGLSWAKTAVMEWQWRRDSARYGIEEVGNCLYKCHRYGTPWHFIKAFFRKPDEDDGYDGFLAKDDQYPPA